MEALAVSRKKEEDKYLIPVVLGTFKVLSELSRSGAMNLAALSKRTGIAKSTVFRILNTLHHLGYVWRDVESRNYSLTPRLSDLSRHVDWDGALQKIATPHMVRLRAQFGETITLAKLDSDRVVYVEVLESEHALRLCERKGGWDHAHASALGKVILAFSPPGSVSHLLASKLPALTPRTITATAAMQEEFSRIRRRGYALDREESRLLANCIAAPILDREGFALAAISISGPSSRFNPSRNKTAASVLMEAARQISDALVEKQRPVTSHRPAPVSKVAALPPTSSPPPPSHPVAHRRIR
jgi:DNA-binding IclR family transcriptional regulator